MPSESHELTDLQLAIMRILWTRGEATMTEVRQALHPQRRLALTTVATLLSRLERKGMVARSSDERPYRYRAGVEAHDVRRTMVGGLLESLFHGDVTELVSHLLGSSEVDAEDLERVRSLIDAKERELGGTHDG